MKKLLCIVPLVLLFCFTIACQDKAAMAELEKYRAQAAVEEQNKTLVKKAIEGLNSRSLQMYEEVYAPNCAFYFPSSSATPKSREQDVESSKGNWRALPDIHWTIEEMAAKGNMVAARFIAIGTQREDWNGIPSTGKKFETGGIFTVRIENGKIVEQREDADLLGMMQQLGMELKPIAAKKK